MSTEPITHLEQVVAGATTPATHLEQVVAGTATPVTHLEHVISENSGGGSATLIEKTITQNGVYNAADDSADGYSKVAANVPNTYAAGDEGKVVSGGALVAQSSGSTTQNGTVDTTLINSLTVDVQGGEKTLTKLADISIQEPVSTVAITATDGMKSCDRLYIKLQNVTLSAEDWIYPYINGTPGPSGSSQMGYINKAQTYAVLFELIRFGGEVHGSVIETAYQLGPNRLVASATTRLADSLTEINFRLYTAATTFTSGTIEVWGYV